MKPSDQETRYELRKANALIKLTGGTQHALHPKAITEPGMGGKFTPEGQVLPFPGNTFLCHIDQKSEFFSALCAVQDELRSHPLSGHFTFLPKPSFHMTIFCGVSGAPLGSDGWPKDMPLDASLNQITDAFDEKFDDRTFQNSFGVLPDNLFLPTSVSMRAATDEDEIMLRKIRAELEEITGLYRGDVDSYEFHVSMAYVAKWLNEKTATEMVEECNSLFDQHLAHCGPIHFDRVEFCSFDNMHQFGSVKQKYFRSHERFCNVVE